MKLAEAVVKIDALMEKASAALVARQYFDVERQCVEAMSLAHHHLDFERMARICRPLQEARRLKRQLAIDADQFFVVDGEMPAKIEPGCYLVRPPRVGLDGRMLREMADQAGVPVIVLVREPLTRTGLWPLVALGPVTIRAYIDPPKPSAKKKAKKKTAAVDEDPDRVVPGIEWFLLAGEQIGDAAIASIEPTRSPLSRVEDLWLRLQAHPDHEKLHQALAEACHVARTAGPSPEEREAAAELQRVSDEEDDADAPDADRNADD